jgi:hypothetical protein
LHANDQGKSFQGFDWNISGRDLFHEYLLGLAGCDGKDRIQPTKRMAAGESFAVFCRLRARRNLGGAA